MKTYYVYDLQTDEFICEMRAWSIVDAEIRTCIQYKKESGSVLAFSEKLD